ncbi:hypothetical protein VB773_02640 [Haloarculaceae archaeon H-GB2-1]|nr:hypothetical protein [Haloarculaceae archaeon H-GB2-1]
MTSADGRTTDPDEDETSESDRTDTGVAQTDATGTADESGETTGIVGRMLRIIG